MYIEIIEKGLDHTDYQELYEVSKTRDWAKEMNKRGHSIPIPEIKANPNDPPDVFAEMDGNRIAIEVIRLVKYVNQDKAPITVAFSTSHAPDGVHEAIRQKRSRGKLQPQVAAAWPLDEFRECLKKKVHDKDKKTPRDGSLHKQFLLIVTKELYLVGVLAEYLKKIALPRPQNFDAVYMMGEYVPMMATLEFEEYSILN